MILNGTVGMLAGRAAISWESVTAQHIEERAMQEMNWRVSVTTNIDQQIVTTSAGFRSRHARFLQGYTNAAGDTIQPLLVKFDATVDFISVPSTVSAEDLVGEAFNSFSDREMYRDNLRAADASVFGFVTAVHIRVEGAVPVEEQLVSQATSSSGNDGMVGVIVGIVIGVLLLLAFVKLFTILRRRHHDSKDDRQLEKTNARMQHDPNPIPTAAEPTDRMVNRYVDEILVSDIEDDAVSAMTSLPGLDGLTVMEDRTVSINLDYDFVKQQRTSDTTDNESEASYDASRQGKVTESGTSVSQTLLGLDYVEDPIEEEDDAPFQDAIKWVLHG